MGMDKDKDLTDALVHLIEGKADLAIDKAMLWKEEWVAKCILFLSNSFFKYDPLTAMEIFGGKAGINKIMSSKCIERYFLQGFGGMFRKEMSNSETAFNSAAEILPNDPYIQFGRAFIYLKMGKIDELLGAVSAMGQKNAEHPLFFLLRDIVLDQKRS